MVRSSLISLLAVILATAFAQLASSALMTTLPLQMAAVGGNASGVAQIAAAYSLGFMVGCLRGVPMINRIGHIRAFAGAAGLTALMILLFKNTESFWLWSILRFFMGAALAVLFATSDAWLNESIDDGIRGRVLSFNSIVTGAVAILSQVLVAAYTSVPLELLEVLSAILLAAVVMLCFTRSIPPNVYECPSLKLKQIWQHSPVAVAGSFSAGTLVTSLLTVVPFSLTQAGVSRGTTALMIAMLYGGRLLFQWPIGSLSDRIDRRLIIFGCSLLIACIMLTFYATSPFSGWNRESLENYGFLAILGVVLLFLGGLSFPLQSLSAAHAFEHKPESSISLSTYLLFIWAAGSVTGPVLISLLAPLHGPQTTDLILFLFSALLAWFSAYRYLRNYWEQHGTFHIFRCTKQAIFLFIDLIRALQRHT